jgi:hypothetical protein
LDLKFSNFRFIEGQKFTVHIFFAFQTPPFERKDRKVSLFGAYFSCEQDGEPKFKFDIDSEVLFIYRLIPRNPDFLERLVIFEATPIGRFLGASRSVHDRIQHKRACFSVSFDRCALHSAACKT